MSLLAYTPAVRTLDNATVAANARAYRLSKGVPMAAVARLLLAPTTGRPMCRANLHHYEMGKQEWTEQLVKDFENAVNQIAEQNQ